MLTDCINNYLFVRRAVGFKLDTVEVYLRSFEHFATARGDVYIIGQTASRIMGSKSGHLL